MVINENKVVEGLILEIKKICEENNLRYWLAEDTARDVFLHGKITSHMDNKLFMEVSDLEKLIEVLKSMNKKSRDFETISTNSKYPYLTLKYCNMNTMSFIPAKGEMDKLKAIGIEIIPLRRRVMSSKKRKEIKALENAWYYTRYHKREEFSKNNFSQILKTKIGAFFGARRQGEKLLEKFFQYYRRNTSSNLFYVDSHCRNIELDESFFEGKETCVMSDEEVVIPKFTKEYFSYIPVYSKEEEKSWVSASYSFHEFQNNISISKGVLPQQMMKSPLLGSEDTFEEECGQLYHNIKEVIALDDYYDDKVFIIKNLYKNKDFETIEALVSPNMDRVIPEDFKGRNLKAISEIGNQMKISGN